MVRYISSQEHGRCREEIVFKALSIGRSRKFVTSDKLSFSFTNPLLGESLLKATPAKDLSPLAVSLPLVDLDLLPQVKSTAHRSHI